MWSEYKRKKKTKQEWNTLDLTRAEKYNTRAEETRGDGDSWNMVWAMWTKGPIISPC